MNSKNSDTPNTDLEALMAAITDGFAKTEERFAKLEDRVSQIDERLVFLDHKLDNRFDLLERMMFDHRGQLQDSVKQLETRVARLEDQASPKTMA